MKFWFEVKTPTIAKLTWGMAEDNGYVNEEGFEDAVYIEDDAVGFNAFDTEDDKGWDAGEKVKSNMSQYGEKVSIEHAIELLSIPYAGKKFEVGGYEVDFSVDDIEIADVTISYEEACKLMTKWRKFRKDNQ